MNLKNNKGFAGIDITIGLIVLIIFIPTIFGLIYSVSQTNMAVNRKSTAINLAVNVLENAKLEEYENVANKEPYTETIDEVNYRVTFTVLENNEEVQTYMSKMINVKVEYPIGQEIKSIDISTTLKNT